MDCAALLPTRLRPLYCDVKSACSSPTFFSERAMICRRESPNSFYNRFVAGEHPDTMSSIQKAMTLVQKAYSNCVEGMSTQKSQDGEPSYVDHRTLLMLGDLATAIGILQKYAVCDLCLYHGKSPCQSFSTGAPCTQEEPR